MNIDTSCLTPLFGKPIKSVSIDDEGELCYTIEFDDDCIRLYPTTYPVHKLLVEHMKQLATPTPNFIDQVRNLLSLHGLPADGSHSDILDLIKHIIEQADKWHKHTIDTTAEPVLLEYGKCYITRNGKITGPLRPSIDPYDDYPFSCDTLRKSWTETGQLRLDGTQHPLDIVARTTHQPATLPIDKQCQTCGKIELHSPSWPTCECGGPLLPTEPTPRPDSAPAPRPDSTPTSRAKSDKVGTGLTLIPLRSLLDVGAIFIEGLRYGRDNWKRGVADPEYQEERLEHALLHLIKWKEGDRSEAHLAKVAWFCFTQLELERLENENT